MASTLDTGSSITLWCNAKQIHYLERRADTKKGATEYCLCHHIHALSDHVSVTLDNSGALVGVSCACMHACMHVVVDVASQWCSQCCFVMCVG